MIKLKVVIRSIFIFSLFQMIMISSSQADSEAQNTQQVDGWYISGSVVRPLNTDNDFSVEDSALDRSGNVSLSADGIGMSLALGRKINENIRIEGELFWVPRSLDNATYSSVSRPGLGLVDMVNKTSEISGDTDTQGAMLNFAYDFDTGTPFKPYVAVGVGFAKVELDGTVTILGREGTLSGSDTVLALQGQVGMAYEVAENTNLIFVYRLLSLQDGEVEDSRGTTKVDGNTHDEIMVGIRYHF